MTDDYTWPQTLRCTEHGKRPGAGFANADADSNANANADGSLAYRTPL